MLALLLLTFVVGTSDTLRIDLQGALDMAVRSNLDYRVQALSNTASRLNFYESVTSYLPSPMLQATYSAYETRYGGITPWEGYVVDFSITQPIFSVQKLASVWSGKADLAGSSASLEEAKNSLAYEVESLYLSVLRASKTLEIQSSGLKRAEENLRLIETKERLGQASRLDVLNARVTLNQSKLALANAQKTLNITRRLFLNVLGIRGMPELLLDPPPSPTPEMDLPPLDTLLAAAFERRPSITSLEQMVGAANTGFLGEILSFLPSISFKWSWQYQGEELPSFSEFRDEALQGSGISAALSFDPISYPLQVQKRKTTLDQAKAELKSQKLVVAKEVQEAYLIYRTGVDNLELAHLTLDAAREGEGLAKAQYRLGLIRPLELFDAETRLLNAEADYLSALYDLHLARSGMRYAVGGGF